MYIRVPLYLSFTVNKFVFYEQIQAVKTGYSVILLMKLWPSCYFRPMREPNIQKKHCTYWEWHTYYNTVNYPKKTVSLKNRNGGFSVQINRVTLTKTWFKKKGMLSLYTILFNYKNIYRRWKLNTSSTLRFIKPYRNQGYKCTGSR